MGIIKNLLNLRSILIILIVSLIFFNIDYFIMSRLPGYENNTCVPGGGLTVLNIIFSSILSVLLGISVATFWLAVKILKPKNLISSSTAGTTGFILGNFTIFCPLCLLPAISLLGVSISFSFFTTYNLAIKFLSLGLLLISLLIMNKKLETKSCHICNTL